jgi:hypothetical protein
MRPLTTGKSVPPLGDCDQLPQQSRGPESVNPRGRRPRRMPAEDFGNDAPEGLTLPS